MKTTLIALLALAAANPVYAQHQGHDMHQMEEQPSADPHAGHNMEEAAPAPAPQQPDPHAGHDMSGPEQGQADPHAGHDMGAPDGGEAPPPWPPSEAARSGPAHAADAIFGAGEMEAARQQMRLEAGGMTVFKFLADRLEYRAQEGKDGYLWDLRASYGGDIDKLVVKSEGEGLFGEKPEGAEVQALWSHAIAPFFDLQAGVRYDIRPDPERAHLVIGVEGMAPYMFEVDGALFLSHEGDLTAAFEAEYDQRITQDLILQPRIEANLAAQDIPELGIGSGLSSIEAGLRLKYRIVNEFAPYVGVEWERLIGDTASYARAAGEERSTTRAVFGVTMWF